MIKVKDGYGKLVGDSYKGNANVMLVSDGSDVEKSITSKANTLVERNASGQIESSIATGTAPFVVTSTTKVTNLNADLLDGKHSTEFLTDDRLFTMLVPTGTAIPANADLQTTEYLKVGRYYCSANATAITLKNCPIDKAFMMEVYSPLSTTIDNETTSSYVYRLRKITHYNTGVQYWQYVGSSATAGSFTYGNWYVMPMSLHATNVNASGGSSSLGSETKPVYIDNTGRFALGNEYYSTSDVYNKTEIDNKFNEFNGSIDAPGDGTITIKKNGVPVGSFTMNQSTSDEIDLIITEYEVFTGATASTNGTSGLVPSPIKGDDVKYLKGDGTWSTLGNASSADTITTNPVLEAANNKISVTVGGKKSNELTVPFATTSDKIYTSNVSDNLNHYITFVSDNSDDYKDLKQNINLTYNPYDGMLNSSGINVTNLTSTNIAATNIYIGSSKLEEIFAPIIHYHDYLPLSGGTLAPVNSNTPLNLKGTSSSLDSWLAFQNNNGYLASIGVNSTKSLQYYDGTASYAIYHAGNFPTQKFKINDVTYNIYTSDTVTNFTIYAPTSKGEAGQYLINDGSGITWKTIDPYDYNIKRNTNTVLAGPVSGNSASATFRLLDISDIPDLSTLYLPLTGGTLTGNVTIEKASTGDCMYWTKVTDSEFTPELGFGTGASKNRGIYDSIKGWILKIDTNNIVTFEGKAQEAFYADSAGEVPWTGITGKPDCYNPCAHQHLTDEVISLTGYIAITELSPTSPNLVVSDTLNQALAKLEYKANNGQAAYEWMISVTQEDSDEYINKWTEIVDFLDSVNEGTDILDEFVTINTVQEILEQKIFQANITVNGEAEFNSPARFNDYVVFNTISSDLLPTDTDIYSIGSIDYQWVDVYARNFRGDLYGNLRLGSEDNNRIIYQTDADETQVLPAPTTDGQFLVYDGATQSLKWDTVVDIGGNSNGSNESQGSKKIKLNSVDDNKICPILFTDPKNAGKFKQADVWVDTEDGSGYNPFNDFFVGGGFYINTISNNNNKPHVLLSNGTWTRGQNNTFLGLDSQGNYTWQPMSTGGVSFTASPNTVFAGPSSGTSNTEATFRSLVVEDIPDLSGLYLSTDGGILQGNLQLGNTDDGDDFSIIPGTNQFGYIGNITNQFYQIYASEFYEDGAPLASKYAPISHASSAATYGIGTTSNYGHVKISNGDIDTVSHSNGLVAGMDHIHSSIMSSMSITLPATAGWYRIATSNSGIQRCNGLFSIESAVANRHTTCILDAHTSYGITDATGITVLSCSHWTYAGISKARIVYHTSYSGKYAYLEIYQPYASAGVVTVKLFGNYGWTLLDSVTTGSIPSGYSNKEVTLSNNTVISNSFTGSLIGNASTATKATQDGNGNVIHTTYALESDFQNLATWIEGELAGKSTTDTKNTAGSTNTTSKIYLIGATSQTANPQTYSNANVYATNGELTAKTFNVTGSVSNTTAKITSDATYNMFLSVGGKSPLVIADDNNSNIFVAPGSSYSNRYSLGTSSRLWKSVYATEMFASGGFFESSDEKLKNFSEKILIDLDKLSKIKKNYFTWKDSENKEQQLGVSAQEIRELYPEIVSEQDNGILSVAYDKLSVIALAAIDKLHEENQKLKERLIILETKLN